MTQADDPSSVAAIAGTGALSRLLSRRSISPKRLAAPGPSDRQLEAVVGAGLRSPDHAGLTPWRVIHFPMARRGELALLFTDEKRRRDPLASADDMARASAHATAVPTLLAFVVCIRHGVTVPVSEQWLAAGAALGNILNAFHVLGFGAVILSGDRCSDETLARGLGLADSEVLAGFISAGTIVKSPPAARAKPLGNVLSAWRGMMTDRAGLDDRNDAVTAAVNAAVNAPIDPEAV